MELKFEIEPGLAATLETDNQRVQQILKNLLSNAIKFTNQGSVTLKLYQHSELTPEHAVALSVIDTGIGIPADKQRAIFEAFQQADGSTSREFGGTGLGLTISRELAKLLGGELHLKSQQGEGSTFTLYLSTQANMTSIQGNSNLVKSVSEFIKLELIDDDREQIKEGDKSLLIIEDDSTFSKVLLKISREKQFKSIVAANGLQGLELAKKYQPSGIILDLGLPDIDGVTVLDTLKQDLSTRHIPIHIISARDDGVTAMQSGAINFLLKPVSSKDIEQLLQKIEKIILNPVREVLVVEDNAVQREEIVRLIKNKQIKVTDVADGMLAKEVILSKQFDCMILDLELPGMSGFELLQELAQQKDIKLPPVIVNTARELTTDEHKDLMRYTKRIIMKDATSAEHLLDEVSLFLHSLSSIFTSEQQNMMRMLHDSEKTLSGKKILLVDDDVRNTFALSKELRNYNMTVILADNGELALKQLEQHPDVDLVLMDIMMPVMDGYEAMTQIRQQDCFKDLPIIAVTALAMPEDRTKCITAGANDYMSKPLLYG